MLGNRTKAIKAIPALAIAGWLATTLPSTAASPYYYDADVNATYYNDYRVCAARLLKVGIPVEAGAQACATAARPGDLSSCVYRIKQQTQISSIDALPTCRQAWLPTDTAKCVVGISKNSREAVDPSVLNYCGRSLLPVNFARCVVGLHAEIDVARNQAMETCINASDSVSGLLPSFIPTGSRQETPTNFEVTPPSSGTPNYGNPGGTRTAPSPENPSSTQTPLTPAPGISK
jgi:hypothetical protein